MLGDRGYDAEAIRQGLCARRIIPFLAKRNTEHGSGLGRWRWVVERTFAWLNQFRRLRVRYEKRADIHEGFLALVAFSSAGGFLTDGSLSFVRRSSLNYEDPGVRSPHGVWGAVVPRGPVRVTPLFPASLHLERGTRGTHERTGRCPRRPGYREGIRAGGCATVAATSATAAAGYLGSNAQA